VAHSCHAKKISQNFEIVISKLWDNKSKFRNNYLEISTYYFAISRLLFSHGRNEPPYGVYPDVSRHTDETSLVGAAPQRASAKRTSDEGRTPSTNDRAPSPCPLAPTTIDDLPTTSPITKYPILAKPNRDVCREQLRAVILHAVIALR